MTDTWAAKVLADVPKMTSHGHPGASIEYDDALAAIAKLGAGDGLVERAEAALEGVTPGKPVQFHPSYCEEAKGAPFSEWDSSHDLSVILPDGKRYRIGSFRHAADAGFYHFTRQWVPEAAAHIAALTAQVAENRISEPHDPGDFVGDIYFGHPVKTTMGTHRWTGSEWVKLPSETEALMGLLADARSECDALRAKGTDAQAEALKEAASHVFVLLHNTPAYVDARTLRDLVPESILALIPETKP